MRVRLRMTNNYSDGHHSERIVELDAPENGMTPAQWFEEVVYTETGDGHGIDNDLGSCYTATVIEGPPELLGVSHEWLD